MDVYLLPSGGWLRGPDTIPRREGPGHRWEGPAGEMEEDAPRGEEPMPWGEEPTPRGGGARSSFGIGKHGLAEARVIVSIYFAFSFCFVSDKWGNSSF